MPCRAKGKPQQNTYIERYNRTVRHERLIRIHLETTEEAQEQATQWLWTYNNGRPNNGHWRDPTRYETKNGRVILYPDPMDSAGHRNTPCISNFLEDTVYVETSTYGRHEESRNMARMGKRHSDGNNISCHREAARNGIFLPAILGGIQPRQRRRCLTSLSLEEREEISRGLVTGGSLRSIAGFLQRSPLYSKPRGKQEWGSQRYRATVADDLRPKFPPAHAESLRLNM